VEGKIAAARFALDHNIPYLGICLGMQAAVIAAARKAGLRYAHSAEFSDTKQNVVYIMGGQAGKESTGGTLRLGNYSALLSAGSKVAEQYGAKEVVERHRHRYEVNQAFLHDIKRGGIIVSGTSPDGKLVEFIEAPQCDYYIATQAHPEFRSRPGKPHPLFSGLLSAAKGSLKPQHLPTLTKVS
jgi:CTP synthase